MKTFLEFLNEIHVKEQKRDYYVLPININYRASKKEDTKEKAIKRRNNYASEIIECIRKFLKDSLTNSKKFYIQTTRDKNEKTFKKLGINVSSVSFRNDLIKNILMKLQPEDFRYDITDEKGVTVYVFEIENYKTRLNITNDDMSKSTSLYIKFEFLYKIIKKLNDTLYITPDKNQYYDMVIDPEYLTLNQISLHTSKPLTKKAKNKGFSKFNTKWDNLFK